MSRGRMGIAAAALLLALVWGLRGPSALGRAGGIDLVILSSAALQGEFLPCG